jgi:hypothetical protein
MCIQGFGEATRLKETLGRLRRRLGMILEFIFKKCDWEPWTGWLWLKIGVGGGLL